MPSVMLATLGILPSKPLRRRGGTRGGLLGGSWRHPAQLLYRPAPESMRNPVSYDFPDFMDLLVVCVESGFPFNQRSRGLAVK